jgi:trimethylamine monooxygenase
MTGETNLYPANLYRGTVWLANGNNKVLYLGMQEPVYSYTMFDVQALWGLHYITGLIRLPERQAMDENIIQWIKR